MPAGLVICPASRSLRDALYADCALAKSDLGVASD